MSKTASKNIYNRIHNIIEHARANIMRSVNSEMVQTYWQIGKEIVEEEQKGKGRAEYGKRLLENLAVHLRASFGEGYDETNLRKIRQFYLIYPIRDAVRLELTWTHYRILMRLDNPKARSFYEIETIKNNWSSRELERQKGSLLFERLALSRDKKGVVKLAQKGHELNAYQDMIKDPYVLEFTGLSANTKKKNLKQKCSG